MVRPVDRHEAAYDGLRFVLPHPFAGHGHAQAVSNDIDLLRTGESQHCANEATQIGYVRCIGVSDARAARLICGQIALIALIAKAPEFTRRVAMVGQILRKPLHAAVRIARRGKWRVVVAVQKDDRRVRHRTGGTEADHRCGEGCVFDNREA